VASLRTVIGSRSGTYEGVEGYMMIVAMSDGSE
jgi:hypothetical protein